MDKTIHEIRIANWRSIIEKSKIRYTVSVKHSIINDDE